MERLGGGWEMEEEEIEGAKYATHGHVPVSDCFENCLHNQHLPAVVDAHSKWLMYTLISTTNMIVCILTYTLICGYIFR
jgi:hypothetical protein